MTDRFEIRGGAGESEAAVIAVVIDQIAREEKAALSGRTEPREGLPAWIRAALYPEEAEAPRDIVRPEGS